MRYCISHIIVFYIAIYHDTLAIEFHYTLFGGLSTSCSNSTDIFRDCATCSWDAPHTPYTRANYYVDIMTLCIVSYREIKYRDITIYRYYRGSTSTYSVGVHVLNHWRMEGGRAREALRGTIFPHQECNN